MVRLNLRGAGPSRPLCGEQYHAGRSGDLAAAISALAPELAANGILAIGYSLGGNMLLKYLGEAGSGGAIRCAAAVSAPIDLAAASRRFHRRRNWVYTRWLLSRMKEETLAPGARLSGAERAAISSSRTIWDFDETFVAPRNGFDGAGRLLWPMLGASYSVGYRRSNIVGSRER